MRTACRNLAVLHEELKEFVRPGVSTLEIDRKGEELIRKMGCEPNFKGYDGYPATVCVSVNDEVVHGIPSKDKVIREGDIVSLDTGMIYKGWHSDGARTWGVGKVSEEAERLMKITEECFFKGLEKAYAGSFLYEISESIGEWAGSHGYGVVRDLVGHGIGMKLHEDPDVYNFPQESSGLRLQPGMTLAIEPMITCGSGDVIWDREDGWTVRTKDKSLCSHYENTVLITEEGPEILTRQEGNK